MSLLGRAKAALPAPLKQAIRQMLGRQGVQAPPVPTTQAFQDRYFADAPVDPSAMGYLQAHKFPDAGPLPWLDRPDTETLIAQRLADGELTAEEAEWCRRFARDGYVILEDFFDPSLCDQVWARYEAAVQAGVLQPSPEKKGPDDPHPGHVMNAHLQVPEVGMLFAADRLVRLISLFLGRPAVPFQTLMFPKGREQKAHSDSIHMTTYPLGYLAASWIACEDIHPDSGALMYYPGSHRLPYVFSREVGLSPEEFRQHGYAAVEAKYEPHIDTLLANSRFERHVFTPRKGTVLIWHANLLHGGSPRTDLRPSRKSLVGHYFAQGAFCYHDLSGDPADVSRYAAT